MRKKTIVILVAFVAIVLLANGVLSISRKNSPIIGEGTVNEDNTEQTTNINEVFSSEEGVTESDLWNETSSVSQSPREISTEEVISTSSSNGISTFKNIITTTSVSVATTIAQGSSGYAYSYAGFNPKNADMSVGVERLLVNRDYILPENYTPSSLSPSVTSIPDSKKLDSRVAPHYNEMYLAAKADGIILEPISGYRSYTLQKNNFENKINTYMNQGYNKVKATQEAATIILPPGTSEHNAGIAMDICSLYESFETTKEYKWLDEHAADYGFILRYPKNKQSITKIIYEPWHWRYVGVAAAKEIKAKGICLEEYLGKY